MVHFVQDGAAAASEPSRFLRGDVTGIEPAVLPSVDQARQRPRRPALVVEILRLQDLLQEPQLVVRVEDGEVRPQPDKFGVHAQDLDADRMERAEPGHALRRAGEHGDALAHLARGLVGERHRENFVRASASGRDQMGDAGGQHAGLADPRARENKDRTVKRLDGAPLLVVEPREIGRQAVRARRAERARRRRSALVVESLGSLRHGTNHAPPTWEAQSGLSTLFDAAHGARPGSRGRRLRHFHPC